MLPPKRRLHEIGAVVDDRALQRVAAAMVPVSLPS